MSCRHPEEDRDELEAFGRKHEWCGACGAMRNQFSLERADGTQTMEWGDWREPGRPVTGPESCASCCYSVEDPHSPDRSLLCRRYPPTPVVTFQAMDGFHTTRHMLPVVTATDWCGEYLPPVEAR